MNRNQNGLVPAIEQVITSRKEVKSESIKTQEDIFNEIFMQPHNKRHANGRVHTGIPIPGKDDWFLTVSVSPDFDEFESQIEEGIYPAVKALVDKGYMTISSCHGHPGRIHLQLGFGNEHSREHLIDAISSFKIPTIKFIKHDHCANSSNDGHDFSRDNLKNAVQIGEGMSEDDLVELNAKSFNFQFHKKYKRWYFLDINLVDDASAGFFKRMMHKRNLKRKDEFLRAIIDAVSSDRVRPYYEVYREGVKIDFMKKQEELRRKSD